jgi:RNA-splicing ligase RtcB
MNGDKLIEWGFRPGPWFKDAIAMANEELAKGTPLAYVEELVRKMAPADPIPLRTNTLPFSVFANPQTDADGDNIAAVVTHMDNLMRVPTIKAGAVMPDACPAGSAPGTIPVGGVVACENAIHPGFHSADICCSVAISVLGRTTDAKRILDSAEKISHFGPGGRKDNDATTNRELGELLQGFASNSFLKDLESRAMWHFMTQGDGNHFFFVGELSGKTVIVTHHGSRGLGADLYKRGKACAERMTRRVAASIPTHQSWIPADTEEGRQYWAALQIVRNWTKLNHFAIHDAVARSLGVKVMDRWWNEHNFVFQKSDGLFYHAKGATPNYRGFAPDASDLTLIPLNMQAGVLIADHRDFEAPAGSLEFCPHGAGRNKSRSDHMRALTREHGDSRGLSSRAVEAILAKETEGIDARFWSGKPDLSELPSAYKDAEQIVTEIEEHKLANVSARIRPLGSIMAGNDDRDWRSLKAKKDESNEAV